jgi:ribosomal protein S18 acetylase RimI-like enzyme
MHLAWYDETHASGLVEVVQAVAALGGAVGWLHVPEPPEVMTWLDGLTDGGVRLAVATDGDRVLGCAGLRRQRPVVLSRMAEITKVMTHPTAVRQGVARALMDLLMAQATADGVELLTLECRGNNHGALRLYAQCGFQVTGRRPDAIAVGDERFDQVLLHADLRSGTSGLIRHGGRREGPGAT